MGEAKRRREGVDSPRRQVKGQKKFKPLFQALPKSVGERILINGMPYFRDSGGNLRLLNESGRKRLSVLNRARKERMTEELDKEAEAYKAKLDAKKENRDES